MRKLAPWPVDWIDPSEAVALRALEVFESTAANPSLGNEGLTDLAYLTSNVTNSAAERLLQGFGLRLQGRVAEVCIVYLLPTSNNTVALVVSELPLIPC